MRIQVVVTMNGLLHIIFRAEPQQKYTKIIQMLNSWLHQAKETWEKHGKQFAEGQVHDKAFGG